jgi:hypothetical protein
MSFFLELVCGNRIQLAARSHSLELVCGGRNLFEAVDHRAWCNKGTEELFDVFWQLNDFLKENKYC